MSGRISKIEEKGSFDACRFSKTSPVSVKEHTTTINFTISFEEALKFNLAVDECVRRLNGYNRAKTRGKQAGSTPILRTLSLRLILSQRSVHVEAQALQPGVQAGAR